MPTDAEVVHAIVAHHNEMQATLIDRVAEVVTAARDRQAEERPVDALRVVLQTDVLPHARAEEEVLYAAAVAPQLRALVSGMVFEHETLASLVQELAQAKTAVDAATVARAVQEVFVGHVRRENELLLPALAADPTVELAALLPEMQKQYAAHRDAASS